MTNKTTKNQFGEFLGLMWLRMAIQKRNAVEFVKIAWRYYSNLSFFKVDMALLWAYLFANPFQISKHFWLSKGENENDVYGETPLTSMEIIAKKSGIRKIDTVFELGCGRGRTCFWLHSFIGCKVVGLELVPDFVARANYVKAKCKITDVEFRCENILETDFKDATVIYFYGTTFSDDFIKKLIAKLSKLPVGTKVITVSYPLTDYMDKPIFEVMKVFPVDFTWGSADVYLHYVTAHG